MDLTPNEPVDSVPIDGWSNAEAPTVYFTPGQRPETSVTPGSAAPPVLFHTPADSPYSGFPAPVCEPEVDLPGSAGEHLLQMAYGSRKRAERFYSDQVLDHLNEEMVEFVGRMEMAFVATADAHGEADCSLRAGPPGFIQVLDQRRVAYPEYRGNGVLASLGNISENPHVGVMLVDFVRDQIGLHINGRARIVEDEDLRAEFDGIPEEFVRGRTPERWVVVDIVEAYIHCRKHIPRMQPADGDQRSWGTDDAKRKGGDYFGVRKARKEASAAAVQEPLWHAVESQSRVNGS
ncbi:MAG: pyridoxamine 5'-phosphate oxidase family protein [Haloechinothrix sp.]